MKGDSVVQLATFCEGVNVPHSWSSGATAIARVVPEMNSLPFHTLPKAIRRLSANYFNCLAAVRDLELERVMSAQCTVDVFTYLNSLECFVLCWSSSNGRGVHRVFLRNLPPDLAMALKRGEVATRSLESLMPGPDYNLDISVATQPPECDAITFVPLMDSQHVLQGFIRVIGPSSLSGGWSALRTPDSPRAGARWDWDLFAHLIGRWAGSSALSWDSQSARWLILHPDSRRSYRVVQHFIAAFLGRCHTMYWRRNFGANRVEFESSATPLTSKIIGGMSEALDHPRHLFSIVTRFGRSVVLHEIPEDLDRSALPELKAWVRDEVFHNLTKALGCAGRGSYLGIPLKVDDAVVGVFSAVTWPNHRRLTEAERFARACIAELGRTCDKEATRRSSVVIRERAQGGALLQLRDMADVGRDLVERIAATLVPSGGLIIGAKRAFDKDGPERDAVREHIHRQLDQHQQHLLEDGRLRGFYFATGAGSAAANFLLVMPVSTANPFLLYILGPAEALFGRSLWAALEELQAVLITAGAASVNRETIKASDDNVRAYLKLWARLHDFKNASLRLVEPLSKLQERARGATVQQLRDEIDAFGAKLSGLIRDWKRECDDILGRSTTRQREEASVIELLTRAHAQAVSRFNLPVSAIPLRLQSPHDVAITTFTQELVQVVAELVTNILKHFERVGRTGDIFMSITDGHSDDDVVISIWDQVPEPDARRQVRHALSGTTELRSGLATFVQPVVRNLFKGEVWATDGPVFVQAVQINLRLPRSVSLS